MTKIYRCTDLNNASLKAAEIISTLAVKCVQQKGYFTFILAGGNTPKLLYQKLASPLFIEKIPWQHIFFFWGDERMVPHNHPASNAALAYNTLFDPLEIAPDNIFPIPTEKKKAEHNARFYEQTIIEFFKKKSPTTDKLSFDCILLGMGTDGHTASLFPKSPALDEKHHITTAVKAPAMHPQIERVTITLPLINQAATTLFLIDGIRKDIIAQEILNTSPSSEHFPAALVQPTGELFWCISRPTESS